MNHTFKIITATSIVFILQLLFGDFMLANFALIQDLVAEKPWMVVTAIFMHGGIAHFLINMFVLAMFGSLVEKIVGKQRFLYLYFGAGILANLISLPFYEAALGASGAIMAIMGCIGVLRPKMIIYVYFLPMPMWVAVILYAIIDLVGAINPVGNVGNIAHLAGLGAGLIFGWIMRGKAEKIHKRKKRKDTIELSEDDFREWQDQYMK